MGQGRLESASLEARRAGDGNGGIRGFLSSQGVETLGAVDLALQLRNVAEIIQRKWIFRDRADTPYRKNVQPWCSCACGRPSTPSRDSGAGPGVVWLRLAGKVILIVTRHGLAVLLQWKRRLLQRQAKLSKTFAETSLAELAHTITHY